MSTNTTNPSDTQPTPTSPRTGGSGLHVGDKLKGAIQIVHGAGDSLRGSALGVIDQMGGGGVTKNEEISRKGKEEFERGMAHWKGQGQQTGAGVHGQAATQDMPVAAPYGAQGAPSPYGPQGADSQYGPQGTPAQSSGGQGTGTAYGQGRAGDVKTGGQQDTSYPSNQSTDTSYPGGQRYDAPTGQSGLPGQPRDAGVGSNYPATPGQSGSGARDV